MGDKEDKKAETVALNFLVDKELLKRIDRFRFTEWYSTRSNALRTLLDKALSDWEKVEKKSGPLFK
jgi:metal-responsive CopG/Arc/MetJ family transcriptional regulator